MANQSQNSGEPSFCANNCGFFGNPATKNLCSKCYKDSLMKQAKELGSSTTAPTTRSVIGELTGKSNHPEQVGEAIDQQSKVDTVEVVGSSSSEKQSANRCGYCKKRVGLTGFKCRCGQTFCSLHRYSDKHNCVFDYKTAGQEAIARANPVVKADKIEKI